MVGILYLEDQGFSFTGKATETISGGQLVKVVSGANVLSSTSNLGNTIDVSLCDAVGDIGTAAGVAINTATSGNRIGVATTGIHGFYATQAVAAGQTVVADGNVSTADAVDLLTASTSGAACRFGKSLTSAASGQLVAVRIG
jgi:hypothetical protein